MAMPQTADYGFDAAIVDRENHPVAVVEVKARPIEKWANIITRLLAKFPERVPFVLTIDPNYIQVYRPAGQNLGEPIVKLDTPQVLQHYDPHFSTKRVFESYLVTLAEAWLRDLAYHWKSENPPASEELREAGLLEKLEGGSTLRLGA
jgi:hypothetical protein